MSRVLLMLALLLLASPALASSDQNPDRQNVYLSGVVPFGDQTGVGFVSQITLPAGSISWVAGWGIQLTDVHSADPFSDTSGHLTVQTVSFGAKFYF